MEQKDVMLINKVWNDIGNEQINKKEINQAYNLIENGVKPIEHQILVIDCWCRRNYKVLLQTTVDVYKQVESLKYIKALKELSD